MIQGGGYDRGFAAKPTLPPVPNESRNGLSNQRGTVAAARASDPDSATSQFYINLADNNRLDGTADQPGYTVFGRVTAGMDTVDKIASLPTRAAGPFDKDVPQPLVGITSMAKLDSAALAALPAQGRDAAIEQKISAAVDAGDYATAMQWIDNYRATCATMTPHMLVTEARAAIALMRRARARNALDAYFAAVDEHDGDYSDAVALYKTVAPHATANPAQQFGDCEKPKIPKIPEGATADLDTMLSGQKAVRAYIKDSEMFLDCLSDIIDKQTLSGDQHTAAVQEHNRTVTQMENLAEKFNEQVRAYKTRQ
jgi:cyclophilin family peptidyl-prolyl cis-trans isomerase